MGPRERRSTVLTPVEEAMIVAFRQRTMLPLDDVMGCLRDSIPNLTRSSLHRCLERHGISRLPATEVKTARGRFAETTIGYIHIDSCELRHADGKVHMLLAIDRVSKFTFVEFYDKAGKMNAAAFLEHAVEAFPYHIHTVLTDNGVAFADLPKNRTGPNSVYAACISSGGPLVSVAGHAAADDLAFEHAEGGEQGRGAVAFVIVGHGCAAARLHRQAGPGAVKGLDLALLVDGHHHGMAGRVHVEADHVVEPRCLVPEFGGTDRV